MIAGIVANEVPTFTVTNTNLCVTIATLSTQDNLKLLKELEYGFKRKITFNKYQPKIDT